MDLHLHSLHSDGTMSIEEIIDLALQKGIKLIAITDHDTISGVKEAELFAKGKNIKIVPGIEINTDYKKHEVHILGYFIDVNNKKMKEILEKLRDARVGRVKKIIEKLNALNIGIDFDDVLKEGKGDSIGRPHVALAMIKKGYAKKVSEIFDQYLEIGRPAYVERFKLTPYDAIDLINGAGGIAVLAHPKLVYNDDIVDELLPHLDGIEIYHSEHSKEDIENYLKKSLPYDLIITGGSDCHGHGKNRGPLLGSVKIPQKYVEKFYELLGG